MIGRRARGHQQVLHVFLSALSLDSGAASGEDRKTHRKIWANKRRDCESRGPSSEGRAGEAAGEVGLYLTGLD